MPPQPAKKAGSPAGWLTRKKRGAVIVAGFSRLIASQVSALSDFLSSLTWPGLAGAIFVCVLAVAGAIGLIQRARMAMGLAGPAGESGLLAAALNNMSQGLCMFDRQQRLIICNSRYAEMYGLPSRLSRPGTTLRQILEYRVEQGDYPGGDPEVFIRERSDGAASGKAGSGIVKLKDGRVLHTVRQPMRNGGWVATHEDVTERQQADQQFVEIEP